MYPHTPITPYLVHIAYRLSADKKLPLISPHLPTSLSHILRMATLTTQELTTLSTKAIDAKATAYCMTLSLSLGVTQPPDIQFQVPQHQTNTLPGPYSKFRVGACILTTSGEFISGANVENAAYPVGTCAERVTIGAAVVCSIFSFLVYLDWFSIILIVILYPPMFRPLLTLTGCWPQRFQGFGCRDGYQASCIALWNV